MTPSMALAEKRRHPLINRAQEAISERCLLISWPRIHPVIELHKNGPDKLIPISTICLTDGGEPNTQHLLTSSSLISTNVKHTISLSNVQALLSTVLAVSSTVLAQTSIVLDVILPFKGVELTIVRQTSLVMEPIASSSQEIPTDYENCFR